MNKILRGRNKENICKGIICIKVISDNSDCELLNSVVLLLSGYEER